MIDKSNMSIYYVSDSKNGQVYIIDFSSHNIIKKIKVGLRPHNIVIDERNNVYIASDIDGKITIISSTYDIKNTLCINNNGNVQVDVFSNKLYVSNTEEIYICNLLNGEIEHTIKGFLAADTILLDKNKKRLFVLDILQNEIKVYETATLQLINVYENVGFAPSKILLGDNENLIYVINKNIKKRDYETIINRVNVKNGKVTNIIGPKGTEISSVVEVGKYLYVANRTLHRVEVIDIVKNETLSAIKTTFSEAMNLKVSCDKNFIFIGSYNKGKLSAIDKIDICNNTIVDTFFFESNNIIPYDIGISMRKDLTGTKDNYLVKDKIVKKDENSEISILAKKIVAIYEDRLVFNNVTLDLSYKNGEFIDIGQVDFKKCEITNKKNSEKIFVNDKEHLLIEYDFYIPYSINCMDEENNEYILEGKISGVENAILDIPLYARQKNIEIAIESYAELIRTPVIIKGELNFKVSALLTTRGVVEEIVNIPICSKHK